MNLLQELHDLITRYLDGAITIEGLEYALGDLAIPISEGESAEAAALNGHLWRLLSEYGYGHRAEPAIKGFLRQLMPVRFQIVGVSPVQTVTRHSQVDVTLDIHLQQASATPRLAFA